MKKVERKTAQELQDEIFRKMSADQRLDLGVKLWKLGKALAPEKFAYGIRRPQRASNRHR